MKILLSIGLLLAVLFLLPLPADLAALQDLDLGKVRLGLAFFACIACLWMTEALPIPITALLVPVLGAALGLAPIKESLTSFASPLIYLFFGGFALAAALSAQGLDLWLAEKLVRLGKGKFLLVAIYLFLGTAFLSMWMSNTSTTAMMIPLALGILARFKSSESSERNSYFLLLGLAFSASIGGLGTLVGSPTNGIAAKQLGMDFVEWMKVGLPAVLVLLPAMFGLLWLLLRPSHETSALVLKDKSLDKRFTPAQWTTLGIFALTALGWINSARIGPALGLQDTDAWIALAAVVALSAARVVSWKEIEQGTDWGVMLLFGGGLALSAILGSSGASMFMARLLGDALEAWPLWAILAAVVAFVIFLTELSSNTATAALVVPIFYAMAIEFDLAPAKLIVPLGIAASCAFMLPVATPPNAIVFGTGMVPQRVMMRTGIVLNLVFVALITALSLLVF